MSRDQVKSAHYISELDVARCNGSWDLVPELVRKIKKHAPNRICLTLTAEAEHAVVQDSHVRPTTARPATARPTTAISPTSSASPVSKYIPLLLDAIEKEKTFVEDEFQARVCLGWIYWQQGEAELAVSRLPKDIEQDFAQLDGTNKESGQWTKVCALKATYIKGTAQTMAGESSEAVDTFETSLPILFATPPSSKQGIELRTWTELYLTGFCMVSSTQIRSRKSNILETETLTAFRAWAKFWDSQGSNPAGGRAPHSGVSRRKIWKEYYVLLSDVLEQDLPFSTTALTATYTATSTKSQQREELKRVEHRYETLLLSEIQFPKAEEPSEEVEAFVDLVMQNWRTLCGSGWHDEDLGEGGAEGISRGVLDILYRAATKTFHSTALLRHLFTVHLSVAEFDLAFKAFDTYMEIVKKGKARIEKTGEPEPGLDNDETVLRTASECIKALCRYGRREEAEKAKDIGNYFEEWLDKHYPAALPNRNGRLLGNGNAEHPVDISPAVFSISWRSIGIAHAQWARVTFDGSSRPDIQLKAIKCFRKALSPEYENTADVETLFALGTILAERRELGPAVDVVKAGLLPQSSLNLSNGLGPYSGRFARERALIPLWHLLALLLSARQEFITAARSCEGAFEQFQDPSNLFGAEELGGAFRSEHLNEKAAPRNLGVVDDMDDFEKENVLEVKMTQLSLIEVLEGPEVAVNASDELLSLYSRLFGDPQKELSHHPKPGTALVPPPQSSAGTIRSVKGSIFGRRSRSVRKSQMSSLSEDKPGTARPLTAHTVASTVAPKIQVTNENGNTSKHHAPKEPHHHEKLQKKESVSRKSGRSLRDRSASSNRGTSNSRSTHAISSNGDEPRDSTDSHQPLPLRSQQLHQTEPALQPFSTQDTRLPHISGSSATSPITRFPKDQQRRRRTSILVKVWLLIAGFYRRASLYDDARGAIEEASKLVQGLEVDVCKESSLGVSVDNAGMGGGRIVGELWGNIYSERGYIAVAENAPYSALAHFESALTNLADHPSATVGISNILLDIYTEELLPPPAIPKLVLPGTSETPSASALNTTSVSPIPVTIHPFVSAPLSTQVSSIQHHGPLGLSSPQKSAPSSSHNNAPPTPEPSDNKKAALLDRLAARDRAYGLLSNLTKLGTGWNYSEAWFALARAYELGGQEEKVREVLWWCVELEEGKAVRGWEGAGSGGYVL